MTIRVLIADDHRIVRDGIRALLEKQPDMQLVAEAENGREAVRLSKKLTPNVLVMDLTMRILTAWNAILARRSQLDGTSPFLIVSPQ